MKKSFSQKPIRKENRGVAVIFTLGILGLLTVMALGFASTALLNRKLADNTSSAEYARHIAKNIALARARSAVMRAVCTDIIYSTEIDDWNEKDFLHEMDTVLDGVELYRVTDDSGQIIDKTARWQYVLGPEKDPKSNKYPILGRYAFAVVPDSGHLDPVGDRGQTTLPGRYGFSEKEIGVYSLCNGDTGLDKNAEAAAGIKFRTFKEFAAAFQNLDSTKKRNFFKNGYRIQRAPAPDAFWIDLDEDGAKTKDELFLRFNMPTTDAAWNSMTVDTLIGEGAGDSDANVKYTGSNNSIPFIPWLKYWTYSPTDATHWTADLMKKQIAANIIQYNRAEDQPTVTDKASTANWLTDPPSYAGIGRHPMLNEIGFLFRVKAAVTHSTPTDNGDGTITCTYTPTYYITFDAGAELIYPFGPASGVKYSKIWFPDMVLQFRLRKFLTSGKTPDPQATVSSLGNNLIGTDGILSSQMLHGDIDQIKITIPGSDDGNPVTSVQKLIDTSTVIEPMTGEGYSWTNLALLQEPGDWNTSPVYTKAASFWKGDKKGSDQTLRMQIRSITITTSTSVGTADQIAAAMARRMTIEWTGPNEDGAKPTPFTTPSTVVLKYGETKDSVIQRDVAKLEAKTLPVNMTDMAQERIWFVVHEAKDPLVNHYENDWAVKQEGPKILDEGKLTTAGYYPGTLLDSDGHETGTSHLNSTVLESGAPVALLKDNEMKADGSALEEVTLESATDPAWTTEKRLSSSYIRHAPMNSLWELGFISRAEAFKTLNLARTRVFAQGTAYNGRGGGSFAQGDANLLDQIKFSDSTDSKDEQGKIDINARYHKVFEWVFCKDHAGASETAVKWYQNLITGNVLDPYDISKKVDGSADGNRVVCKNDGDKACLSEQHSDSCTETCLAHLLMERSLILPFRNRSDLLLDPDSPSDVSDFTQIPGYDDLSSGAQTKLKKVQRKLRRFILNPTGATTDDAKSKLVREQYAARFMNLLKADNDEEHVYIIVVAQSIKDIGGAPALIDWNGDGDYSSSALTIPDSDNDKMKKFLRTGYIRKKLYTSDYEKIGSKSSVDETITTTEVGVYDYGADKITGETKLIAEMVRDPNTGKWKMTGYRYVE